MQYVKFPMSVLRITQGYGLDADGVSTATSGGTYTHTGSYALDLGGTNTGAEYLYAPCDVEVVRHYKGGAGYNAVWYKTVAPVMCADGQQRELIFMLLHANDSTITELGITVGKQFKQGEAFYKEGTGGGVATHVHLEVGLGPFTGTGWAESNYIGDYDGNKVWIINNKLIPSEIFYLTNETQVVEDMGYNWKYLSDCTEYPVPTGVRVLTGTGKNVQYFNTPNVDDIAGSHLPEGSEYVVVGYTSTPDSYGFTYVKFIYNDGNAYWMAILDDRIELFAREVNTDVSHLLGKTFFVQVYDTNCNLNVHGNDTVENERNVNIYTTEDVKAQRWILQETSAGLKLFTKINELYALNVYTVDDNCSIYAAAGNDKDSIIELEHVEGMQYRIKASSHNKYLCVDGTAVSGTNVKWASGAYSATIWEFIPEEDVFPKEEVEFKPEGFEYGIDVSDIQGIIDWSLVAQDDVQFAIIKAVGQTNAGIYISNYWEDNYKGAKDNGIKVGAYLYTYAFNEAEADEELTFLFNALKGKSFEYPIFVDVEDNLLPQNCTTEEITNTVKYLCAKISEKGYYPAIYTYSNFAKNHLNMDELAEYDLWIADYTGSVTYQGNYDMWQYSSSGSVNGIDGNCDMNVSYKDYANLLVSNKENEDAKPEDDEENINQGGNSMAEKAKHAFGALENIDAALSAGKIDAFDILFVKDANGKPYVGWIDKEGNKVIVQETEKVIVVDGDTLPESGDVGKIYIFKNEGYIWNGVEFVPMSKSADLSDLESQVNELSTKIDAKVDVEVVQTMIEEYTQSAYEIIEF